MTQAQLPLAIQLPDDETFATFVVGDNQDALALALTHTDTLLYLWGAHGVGKSHLLHAICAETQEPLMYVSLRELYGQVQPQVLQGLERYKLICLDDIDSVSHDPDWCYELFALLNRCRDQQVQQPQQASRLLVTAHAGPAALEVALADVHSRLQWGVALQLKSLSDGDKAQALQLRAKTLGLHLSADTAQFMVQRLGRDMRTLMACLKQLDRASIVAKRRLTTPFVKHVLGI
ncbi:MULTISPECIES: DnaA regulatory inactivator Hda [Idiomarinaceae]|jgi:DnaA family protein|uniref:Regulatory inactivation of DnaA Hda protein n=4 Tax=Pseudidiomarina TaxID=2800384 RepID=A0A368V0Q9_9GAMM|nr:MULTISPECIES: DnaA regulatory inactivator Hda [Idiomarinaceae]MDT7524708.1 DnaA regulatory inactivator Hda [Pseudidiomarina sp. GXY010]MDX1525307.1 DnaA regulatory inactivator Hda [Pseudidiomarina maritima]MRJ41399.1 DnaA regulatory inactivator Hda [Idiomarina sp. FeN1]NCU56874.1 DnaA regulatory inactivator Hda [Idiomarina sp. FenA--70]NCU59583.1 DnaA regulatory inactivator Hda [Idiomarina sp. FenBw--71]